MSQTVICNPGAQEVWGYLIPAPFPEDAVFMPMTSEKEARDWVALSIKGQRQLAKRTLGPIELVEDS